MTDAPQQDPDGYYDDDMGHNEEIDLSFLDGDQKEPEK